MTSTLKKISRRVALTLAVSACFSPVTQAAELLTEGVFKVGMEVTYPPFESYDSNNNIVGLDPEFATLIAEHLQAKPQLIDTKFTSLILGIGKKYDAVISGMYVTPERQKQADAIPYALSGASIIALKGGAVQPKTEDELCGVAPGRVLPISEQWHPLLIKALSSIPALNAGDSVWWHCDVIHSVAPVENQQGWGNVMYIPAAPMCEKNLAYAQKVKIALEKGASPGDFPREDYEASWQGRFTLEDLNIHGKRALGIPV